MVIAMEAPLVSACSAPLEVRYEQEPPRLVRWGFHPSPYNPLMIGLTPDNVVCRIAFANKRSAKAILKEWKHEWPRTSFVKDQDATANIVLQMFGKKGLLKLHMTGTKFQQAVWKEMLKVPQGHVVSYATIARKIKRPKAVRAVGTACGANPVPILVPCHRVIASNGGLGGFGGGLKLKMRLLKAEGYPSGRQLWA